MTFFREALESSVPVIFIEFLPEFIDFASHFPEKTINHQPENGKVEDADNYPSGDTHDEKS